MTRTQYDMTIIGGGSGGLTAARLAASLGANVLLIDKERLGGDCLNYGCVPSKSLIHVAKVVHQAQNAAKIRLKPANLVIDMTKITNYIQGVIGRVAESEKIYTEGVTVKFGEVSFKSASELTLNGETFTSRNTLISTGSRPLVPRIEGLEETGYLTNEDVFNLMLLPSSLLIVGAGPIGVELGQAFRRLGTDVTIIEALDRILPKEDPEVSATLTEVLRSEGINVVTDALFINARRDGNKKVVTAKQGEKHLAIEADEILLTLGRQPNVEGLNLEAAGIMYSNKGIQVNEHLETSAPNIFAIGDVIGGYLFTHTAAYQAGIAVRNALVPIGKKKVDYRVVPWCIFTDPEAARVGLTPDEAENHHKQTRTVKFLVADIDRAQAENGITGFIKLVLAGKKEEIVGAHMICAHAGELLGEMALAIQHHLTINDILDTIHAYPTMSTGIQQAAFEAYLHGTSVKSNRKIVQALLRLRK
ncbi:MAG TPA: NAD(P)/FAD-dependent oxidoreductase [Ktedonobacteraceae bacterium]|nr:NAD(P)/FAD-dependent oxidoreductase [Ktedonobacteraceae bacterium]